MSLKKLSDSEQQEIIQLYRTSAETTATLAQRYGVSSSTINRFLKSNFSPTEYEELVQKKRLIGRKIYTEAQLDFKPLLTELALQPAQESESQPIPVELTQQPDESESQPIPVELASQPDESESKPILVELTQQPDESKSQPILVESGQQVGLFDSKPILVESMQLPDESEDEETVDVVTLNELLGEDLEDLEALDDDDDDDLEEEDWEEQGDRSQTHIFTTLPQIEILPLSEAYFPKICYVVIDRFAELITKPLREFADLGKIPVAEIEQKTLPIFDNQKVARRFSNRSQRVIKIPDGRVLKKTSTHLKAKGITRLLIDGQVYAC